jgi:alpha-galactosidase
MRMDYETLSHFSIISTSDQTDYLKYPYIAGNILSSVLPEQAAVWSYPVGVGEIGKPLPYDAEWVQKNITDERIIMNMINSFLGRMHLASHLELLTEEQFSLVKEGVEYYNKLTKDKKNAMPYFPLGFTKFGDDLVVSGLKTQDKIYLAVWNLSDTSKAINIPFDGEEIVGADIAYPKKALTKYTASKNALTVCFESGKCARFFEIQLFR